MKRFNGVVASAISSADALGVPVLGPLMYTGLGTENSVVGYLCLGSLAVVERGSAGPMSRLCGTWLMKVCCASMNWERYLPVAALPKW